MGGYIQLVPGPGNSDGTSSPSYGASRNLNNDLQFHPSELALCGENERYSPPLVLFRDLDQGRKANLNSPHMATLLFSISESTPRSQFLAHYSFTPSGGREETSNHLIGGTPLTRPREDLANDDEADGGGEVFENGTCTWTLT